MGRIIYVLWPIGDPKSPLKTQIPYILKEKHCNKCIHTIIDTWQFHNDLIINMLTRSHYIHKCVYTMYFVFS